MEDGEELTYYGYEDDAQPSAALRRGGFVTGDEEEYSEGLGGEAALSDAQNMLEEEINKSYGDFFVEEFSAETSAHKLSLAMHISERTIKFVLSAVYLVVGVLCVALTDYIYIAFPYIVGGVAAGYGLVQLVVAIIHREYVHTHSNKTASSLVMIALGILIMVEHSAAFTIIAVAWGFLGSAGHTHNGRALGGVHYNSGGVGLFGTDGGRARLQPRLQPHSPLRALRLLPRQGRHRSHSCVHIAI